MKKIITLMSVALLVFSGCAGREGNPVQVHQTGDEDRSISSLQAEMKEIDERIAKLIPESSKTGRNVVLGAAGLLLWPFWLGMDLKNGEKEELEALQARRNYLSTLLEEKQGGSSTAMEPVVNAPAGK